MFQTDGAIYHGYTDQHIKSELFKINVDDVERNLKTFSKDSAKSFIKSKTFTNSYLINYLESFVVNVLVINNKITKNPMY